MIAPRWPIGAGTDARRRGLAAQNPPTAHRLSTGPINRRLARAARMQRRLCVGPRAALQEQHVPPKSVPWSARMLLLLAMPARPRKQSARPRAAHHHNQPTEACEVESSRIAAPGAWRLQSSIPATGRRFAQPNWCRAAGSVLLSFYHETREHRPNTAKHAGPELCSGGPRPSRPGSTGTAVPAHRSGGRWADTIRRGGAGLWSKTRSGGAPPVC